MYFGIAFLGGIFIFFTLNLFIDLVMGDRGKEGQIKSHYVKIKGDNDLKIVETTKVMEEAVQLSMKSYKIIAVVFSVTLLLVSMGLFKSPFIAIALSSTGVFIPNALKKREEEKKMDILGVQFRDALNTIRSSLKAGASMNSAIMKCPHDLEKIHANYKDKIIISEFKKMSHDLNMGIPLEAVLISFKERLPLEETADFVNSVIILKQKGGNLVDVMENTIIMIADKMEIKSEIKVLTASKKLESLLLSVMPLVLVSGLALFAPDYMAPLFTTWAGNVMCFIGFGMLVLNFIISKKLTNIEV